jgi:hypothetical protein
MTPTLFKRNTVHTQNEYHTVVLWNAIRCVFRAGRKAGDEHAALALIDISHLNLLHKSSCHNFIILADCVVQTYMCRLVVY